jgi:chemotaxis protein methyltransferase CheR
VSLPPVERFVALIRDHTGNVVPPARRGFLNEVLTRRARAHDIRPDAYLDALAAGLLPEEWARLVPMVTIKESYFFRAPQQFAALGRSLLPVLARARGGERRLRVWSAACARGEEPGTLAILFAESGLLRGWDWEIVGTDVDEEALEAARRGIYGERAVSHVPPAQLERWFRPRASQLYELEPSLLSRITYRRLNLAHPPYDLLHEDPGRRFDLVFLRNVLIYFRRPLQRRVVATVGEALAPDGALFLGASETLWQIQERLAAYDLGNCFCYRHRDREEPWEPLKRLPPEIEASPEEAGPRRSVDVAWLSPRPWRVEIGELESDGLDGTGRVEAAATGEAAPAVSEPTPRLPLPAVAPGPSLAEALEADEDDDDAHFHAEPCGTQERLLEVATLLAGDDVATAEQRLEAVLEADPSEAAAHALDGFLHDLRGDADDAIQSYRAALYLDPALYQVRLLLADAMNRQGWRERAEHEYREVLASLQAGRDRVLVPFEALPVPDREGAEKRCRRALGGR